MRADTEFQAGYESGVMQAAGWHIRLRRALIHGNELSSSELAGMTRFLSHPENRAQSELAAAVSSKVSALLEREPVAPEMGNDDGYDGSVSVAQWRSQQSARARDRRRARATLLGLALAASCAVLVVGARYFVGTPAGLPTSDRIFQTGPAQSRDIVFSDGSRVSLGADSAVSVRFDAEHRLVQLDRGEASFAVAHDPSRPFKVEAGVGTVTALGTQFTIHRGLDRVTVTVTEGTVLLAPNAERLSTVGSAPLPAVVWQPIRLVEGQKVTYDDIHDRGGVESVDPGSTQRTSGRLQYRDVPLKYIVADVNRYRAKPIEFKDAAASEYGFSGTVFLDHEHEWLLSLEKILPLRVTEKDGRAVIESRTPR